MKIHGLGLQLYKILNNSHIYLCRDISLIELLFSGNLVVLDCDFISSSLS